MSHTQAPVKDAGIRQEPPVSVQKPADAPLAATSAAVPPLLPAEHWMRVREAQCWKSEVKPRAAAVLSRWHELRPVHTCHLRSAADC